MAFLNIGFSGKKNKKKSSQKLDFLLFAFLNNHNKAQHAGCLAKKLKKAEIFFKRGKNI